MGMRIGLNRPSFMAALIAAVFCLGVAANNPARAFNEGAWRATMQLGTRLAKEGNFELAAEQFDAALQHKPEGADYLLNLEYLFAMRVRSGKPAEATATADAALQYAEENFALDKPILSRTLANAAIAAKAIGNAQRFEELRARAEKVSGAEIWDEDPATRMLTHKQTLIRFPEALNEARRADRLVFNPDGSDVGYNYHFAIDGQTGFITVYVSVFPDTPLYAHFLGAVSDMQRRYADFQKISDKSFKVKSEKGKIRGRRAIFSGVERTDYPTRVSSDGTKVITQVWLAVLGNTHIKFRVTFPEAVAGKAGPLVERFIQDFDWPAGGVDPSKRVSR